MEHGSPTAVAFGAAHSGDRKRFASIILDYTPTVRELIAAAKRARERRPELTEYVVSVG